MHTLALKISLENMTDEEIKAASPTPEERKQFMDLWNAGLDPELISKLMQSQSW
jgi:hypothetical protein